MKALIAMSGGVDSSMAAKLTKEAGYECIGCTMKLFDNEDIGMDGESKCCSSDDVYDAGKVAYGLGMPYYVFDFKEEFRHQVMDKFIKSYSEGETPNPCIDCNRFLKFDKLLKRADEIGYDYIVTGHYARVEKDEKTGKFLLKKGVDESKDQSYVLYSLTQAQLSRLLLPLGGLHKSEVREMAEKAGFVNADKPDSQDICFVPDGDYAKMIETYLGKTFPRGEFVDLDGKVIGEHKGLIHYTIGQHKRLGQAFGKPMYVCRIDAAKNQIALGSNEDTFSPKATAKDFNWISGEVPEGEVRCKVKTRYKQKEQQATARALNDDGSEVEIIFDEPLRAVTPGQAAVLYDGDTVLGGGTII